jgi:NitT/TauT family transport system permease protein/taurine transport system permease protein
MRSAALAAPAAPARFGPLVSARTLKGVLGLVLFLLVWQASVPLMGLSSYFYPAPTDVWAAFLDLMEKGILPVYVADSLGRYGAGVALGSLVGIGLGLVIGLSPFMARLFGPLINFFYAIVEAAWLPLFVIWWGYGGKTIILLLIYVVAFPLLYNTLAGVRTVPAVLVNAARSLGASRLQVLREVILPGILPSVMTGFRVGAGFAFRGLIIAEMIAAKTGLGYLIFEGTAHHETARTIVGMICMGLLWLFIDLVYLRPFERATIERWGQVTTAEARE